LKNNSERYIENKKNKIDKTVLKLKNREISIYDLNDIEKDSLLQYYNIKICTNKTKINEIRKNLKEVIKDDKS